LKILPKAADNVCIKPPERLRIKDLETKRSPDTDKLCGRLATTSFAQKMHRLKNNQEKKYQEYKKKEK